MLFLDLDRFKQVNDTHGHAAGDQVLVALAKRLRQGLRPHDHLARISGDEFCAILTEVRDADEVRTVVSRLSTMCDREVALNDGTRVEVGVSIGVALAFSADHQPDELLAHADDDMYVDKRARRRGGASTARPTRARPAPCSPSTARTRRTATPPARARRHATGTRTTSGPLEGPGPA